MAIISAIRGDLQKIGGHQWKWVVLRGSFGTISYATSLLAVAYGSPLGDSSALQSINVVVSALLGRAFLGESLRALHVAGLCLSVAGALLVSKPQWLIGGQDGDAPWLGYSFALLSGFVSGAIFIAARKSQGISPLALTASVTLQEGAIHFVLVWCGSVEEMPLTRLLEVPAEALAMFAFLLFIGTFAAGTTSVGAQMCPAAMSATVYTSTSMSMSFAAQTLLHSEPPELMTLAGATLMLFAVSLMAFARWYYSPIAKQGTEAETIRREVSLPPQATPISAAAEQDGDNETESLASFVASEVSGVSGESLTSARQRRRNPTVGAVVPQVLGLGSA